MYIYNVYSKQNELFEYLSKFVYRHDKSCNYATLGHGMFSNFRRIKDSIMHLNLMLSVYHMIIVDLL